VAVTFTPAWAVRDYTLQATTNLAFGPWVDVPDQGPRSGVGGEICVLAALDAAPAAY